MLSKTNVAYASTLTQIKKISQNNSSLRTQKGNHRFYSSIQSKGFRKFQKEENTFGSDMQLMKYWPAVRLAFLVIL
jgi:hypothetical protein